MTVGILALQGCIAPHEAMFSRIGVACRRVRGRADLAEVDRLLLPGGESTTMLRLLDRSGLSDALSSFGAKHPMWGICAGAILIAKTVSHPEQRSFGLIDISATRNFYGAQLESFTREITLPSLNHTLKADFIRAPLLRPLSKDVSTLASCDGNGVLFRQGRILAGSFHVELGDDPTLHKYFAEL